MEDKDILEEIAKTGKKHLYLLASKELFDANIENIPFGIKMLSYHSDISECKFPTIHRVLQNNHHELKDDLEIQFLPCELARRMAITNKSGRMFAYLHYQSIEDCKLMIEHDPRNIGYVRMQTYELCRFAISLNHNAYPFIRNPDNSDLMKANPQIEMYIGKDLQQFRDEFDNSALSVCFKMQTMREAIGYACANPLIIAAMPQSDYFNAVLVKINPRYIMHIRQPSLQLCKHAISKIPTLFGLLIHQSEEIKKFAIETNLINFLFARSLTAEDVINVCGKDITIFAAFMKARCKHYNICEIIKTAIRHFPETINFVIKSTIPKWLKVNPKTIEKLKQRDYKLWANLFGAGLSNEAFLYSVYKDKFTDEIAQFLSENYHLIRRLKVDGKMLGLIAEKKQSAVMFLRNVTEEEGLKFVEEDCANLKYIRPQTLKQCLLASTKAGFDLKISRIQNEEICLNSLDATIKNFKFIHNKTDQIYLKAVRIKPSIISKVENPTEYMRLAAVESDFKAIRLINNPSEDVCYKALDGSYSALQHIRNPSNNVILYAISLCSRALIYVENQTEEVCVAALMSEETQIRPILRRSRKVRLSYIKDESLRNHCKIIVKNMRPVVRIKSARSCVIPTF